MTMAYELHAEQNITYLNVIKRFLNTMQQPFKFDMRAKM
jgi:hypothetical protein